MEDQISMRQEIPYTQAQISKCGQAFVIAQLSRAQSAMMTVLFFEILKIASRQRSAPIRLALSLGRTIIIAI